MTKTANGQKVQSVVKSVQINEIYKGLSLLSISFLTGVIYFATSVLKWFCMPGIGEISNVDALERNTDANQSGLYVFRNRSYIDQRSEMCISVKSKPLYRISFTIINYPFHRSKTPSILSFSSAIQGSTNAGNVEHYETYFTKDFLNKKALELSEKLKLFNSQSQMTFLIGQNQEWRIKEIFESMLNESLEADAYRNDMMRILIYQFILFSQRLTPVDIQSV